MKVGGIAASAVAFSMKARARRGGAPRAPKRPHPVRFGKVVGENRGKVRVTRGSGRYKFVQEIECVDFDKVRGRGGIVALYM